jgi:FKBP-type peptidyl-prolyl cis-trans isomerase FklB
LNSVPEIFGLFDNSNQQNQQIKKTNNMQTKITGLIIALLLAVSSLAVAQSISEQLSRSSYSAGMVIADELNNMGLGHMDQDAFVKGFLDKMAGRTPQVSEEEALTLFQQLIQETKDAENLKNKAAGEAFLAANVGKPGVIALPSGLQYIVLQKGEGPSPKLEDNITAHYHGTLIDGTVFDSSIERGEPISFPLNGVIQGWQEIVQLMKVGDKFKVFIPQNLAYGEQQAGQVIKPYSAIIFEIELLGINQPEP